MLYKVMYAYGYALLYKYMRIYTHPFLLERA